MSEQPEALYLADELEKLLILGDLGPNGNTAKTIRQLRHLYALCEEMGDALALVVLAHEHKCGMDDQIDNARKVGAKWKESK